MQNTYIFIYSLVFILGLMTAGCNPNQDQETQQAQDQIIEDHIVSIFDKVRISVYEASADEIAQHVVACKGNNSKKVCVQICHLPPGNPDNSKDMVLPLQAILAHLDHGNDEHDFLGPCDGSGDGSGDDGGDDNGDDGSGDDGVGDDNGDDGSGDDGVGDDNGDDGSGDDGVGDDNGDPTGGDDGVGDDSGDPTGGDDGVGNDLPNWCLENFDIDSDCDGINDDNGEPLY